MTYEYKDKEFPDCLEESTIVDGKIRTWNPVKLFKVIKILMSEKMNKMEKMNNVKEVFKDEPEVYKEIENLFKNMASNISSKS
jgi:hypothetical protein